MSRYTPIETNLNEGGMTEIKVGEKVVLAAHLSDAGDMLVTPASCTNAVRIAYKKGRDDATAENRAVLRGLVGI